MTRRVAGLNQLLDREWLDIHPLDAERLGVQDGDKVQVTSRRGSIHAYVRITSQCLPGVVFMDFHFAESPANLLTNAVFDPICKVPEFKAAAVRIEITG